MMVTSYCKNVPHYYYILEMYGKYLIGNMTNQTVSGGAGILNNTNVPYTKCILDIAILAYLI